MYNLRFKLKVLRHTKEFGIRSALSAFEVKKSSIYAWKKKLNTVGYGTNHGVLQNRSTRPINVRTRKGNWDYRIEEFIQKTRITHPGLTKEKVWKLLSDYGEEERNKGNPIRKIPSIATIGRMIRELKNNHQIPSWSRKLSFYANTASFRIKTNRKKKKRKRPKQKKFKLPGERIQIDTVIILKNGIRRYIINAIDVYSRLSFSYAYTSLSSNSAKDFFIKMRQVFPFITEQTEVQNDNGSEFMKNFEAYLKQESITQYWNYPRHPKMNTWIERFNGSIQYEFIYRNLNSLFTKNKHLTEFNQKLMYHLVWYNTKRPHLSLDLKSPLEFILSQDRFSKMWWTSTGA